MVKWEIEKVAAAHLLEALKVVLDHLRDFTINATVSDESSNRNPSTTYAQVRRIRTYAQRCVSAHTEIVEFHLNDDDQNLLAACAVFDVANLDRQLNGVAPPPSDEVGWLEDRRRALAHWAVSFATRKIEGIPVADESIYQTATVQNVLREIQRRVVADHQRTGIHRVTHGGVGSPTTHDARGSAPAPAAVPADRHAPHLPHQPGAPSLRAAPRDNARHGGGPAGHEFGIPSPPGSPPAAPPPPHAPPPAPAPPAVRSAPSQAAPQAAPAPAAPPPGAVATEQPGVAGLPPSGLDLDPRKMHDPRVRSLLLLDLRAFERAHQADDHRLCVVHLGSIIEAACIDYALAHRRDLGLNGGPETWSLEVVLRRVLGDDISTTDRALLFHLSAARTLLRPAIQLANPMVVNAATQVELTQFVRRVLTAMGYSGSGDATPPPPSSGVSGGSNAQPAPTPPVRPSGATLPGWARTS